MTTDRTIGVTRMSEKDSPTMSAGRYIVVDVGCTECNSGCSYPNIIHRGDDRAEAVTEATKSEYSSQYDRFVIDTHTGSTIEPNLDDSDDPDHARSRS